MLNAVEELCQETREMDADRLFHTAQNPGIERFWIWNPNRDLGFLPTCWRGIHFLGEKSVHAGGRSKAEVAWKGLLCPRTYRKRKTEWFLSYTGRWAQSWWENGCVKLWGQGLFGSCATDQYLSLLLFFLNANIIQFFLTEMFFLLLFVIIQHLAFHLTWKGWPNALVKESFAWSSDFIAL